MTTRVEVLYFAVIRELVGTDGEFVDLPVGVHDVATLRRFLEARHTSLAGRLSSVRFAKNEELVEDDDMLGEGDVVALIPPVAGGQ